MARRAMGWRGGARPWAGVLAAVLVAALAALVPAADAGAALRGGGASVSDTNPAPGQVITVSANGLKPGSAAIIRLFPDAVELAQLTVGGDGTFARDVRIPGGSKDGPKKIEVVAVDAAGRYSSLGIDLRVDGPPATANLGDTTLTPNQTLRIGGSRFLPGRPLYLVLFPERVVLGQPTPESDGTFTIDVRMPAQVLNGRHGIVAAGATMGGGFAYIVLDATVSGGVGLVPDDFRVPFGDPLAIGGLPGFPVGMPGVTDLGTGGSSTTSTSSSTSSTIDRGSDGDDGAADASSDEGGAGGVLVLLLIMLLALVGVAIAWLRTTDGRRWWDRRVAALTGRDPRRPHEPRRSKGD